MSEEDFTTIKHCQCKPGEPKEYCRLRERMCKIEAIRPDTIQINKDFRETFSDNEYDKIDMTGAVEESIDKAKKDIMKNALRVEVRKINELITIDYDLVTPEIESQMDFKKLIEEVQKGYAHHEDGTFEEILDKAKELRPFRRSEGGQIEVKKDKIVLRHGVRVSDYEYSKGEPEQVYDAAPNVIAFGRLADIILNDAKPSKSDTRIGNQVSDQFKHDFWNEREVGDTNIKSIKFYKNGKLEIRFRKPEEAAKMGKVLKFL